MSELIRIGKEWAKLGGKIQRRENVEWIEIGGVVKVYLGEDSGWGIDPDTLECVIRG